MIQGHLSYTSFSTTLTDTTLEFRGADILGGKKHWRGIGKEQRIAAYKEALSILGQSKHVRIFGAAIYKAAISPDDPMEYAFEQLCNRFDRYPGRLHAQNGTRHGLIILDESSYETSLQTLAREFRANGHRWEKLSYMCDVPLFVNSKATRMVQYADMVTHALRRYYEHGDPTCFDIFSDRIDSNGGISHGLIHYCPAGSGCNCHSCRQRKAY